MAKPVATSMIFFETDGFEDQNSRSYRSKNFGEDTVERLVRATDKGRNISSGSLSAVVSDIIELDANSNNRIHIPNGWGEKRLSFIIELLLNEGRSNESRQVLTGYTDKSDLSLSGEMDPEMQLFINNSFMITSNARPGRAGRGRQNRIIANDFIIRSAYDMDDRRSRRDRPQEMLLRSEDIFYNRDSHNTLTNTRRKIRDGRSTLDGEVKFARRADGNVANYIESILRIGVTAENKRRTDDYHFGDIDEAMAPDFDERMSDHSRSSVYETASGFTRSGDVDTHGVFKDWLLDTDFEGCGMIELASFESSVVLGCEPVVITPGRIENGGTRYHRHRRGDNEEWGGSHRHDVMPDIIKNSLVSIMLRYTVAEADIMITNDTDDGQLIAHVSNESSVVHGNDISGLLDTIETTIVCELGNIISRNGHDDITVTCNYNMLSGMLIEIDHHDGATPTRYNAAIFTDGLQTNMRTDDETVLDNISEDAVSLVDEILASQSF